MVKTKLIQKRNEKRFTQNDLAEHLKISQTQYSRKEKGDVEFSDEEWEKMSKLLDTDIEDLKEVDKENSIHQYFENVTGNYVGSNNVYCSVPEFLLETQQEYIEILKKEIRQKDAQIAEQQEMIKSLLGKK
jgi:transcriptional regulator with XRE-family HTH domain